jgi:flagellum-specific peptidoglycan hydrolase FlgJ
MVVFKTNTGSKNRDEFIKTMAGTANKLGLENGIPPAFLIAQWGLETGWGQSQLWKKYNNIGGVKGTPNAKDSVNLDTEEDYGKGQHVVHDQWFKVYPTKEAGVKRQISVLKSARYKKAFDHPTDPILFAIEIKKGGYATAKNYVGTISGILKKIV